MLPNNFVAHQSTGHANLCLAYVLRCHVKPPSDVRVFLSLENNREDRRRRFAGTVKR